MPALSKSRGQLNDVHKWAIPLTHGHMDIENQQIDEKLPTSSE